MKGVSIQVKIDSKTPDERIAFVKKRISGYKEIDLIMLPELWSIGFLSIEKYLSEAPEIGKKVLDMMILSAQKLGCYILSGSVLEKEGDSHFNTNYLISPRGDLIGKYRKIHLFGYGGSKEAELLSKGTEMGVFKTDIATFGLATCYDLRFPEMFREMIDHGVNVFLVSAAWPRLRLDNWLILKRARAMENQSFLISSNCIGTEDNTEYAGHSAVIGPDGRIISKLGFKENGLFFEVDIKDVLNARRDFPALNDR